MNIEKAKRLLAKMNVLVDHAGEGLSPLEQDLFRNYAQQLYQISGGTPPIQEEDKSLKSPVESITPKVVAAPQIAKNPQVSISEQEFIPREILEKVEDLNLTEETESSDIEIPDIDVSEIPSEISADIKEKDAEVAEVAEVAEAQQMIAKPITHQNGDGKLASLFEIKKGSDLLAKLSDKPLTKVEQGMGLNERIFTINELFGSDHQLFQSTMSALNEAESFEKAKEYLIENVAKTQDWMAPEKVKMIEKFVQLVYRRFV